MTFDNWNKNKELNTQQNIYVYMYIILFDTHNAPWKNRWAKTLIMIICLRLVLDFINLHWLHGSCIIDFKVLQMKQ